MRHGLEFVNLQNPQVRRPTMRLEQGIVICTEMSRGDPTIIATNDVQPDGHR